MRTLYERVTNGAYAPLRAVRAARDVLSGRSTEREWETSTNHTVSTLLYTHSATELVRAYHKLRGKKRARSVRKQIEDSLCTLLMGKDVQITLTDKARNKGYTGIPIKLQNLQRGPTRGSQAWSQSGRIYLTRRGVRELKFAQAYEGETPDYISFNEIKKISVTRVCRTSRPEREILNATQTLSAVRDYVRSEKELKLYNSLLKEAVEAHTMLKKLPKSYRQASDARKGLRKAIRDAVRGHRIKVTPECAYDRAARTFIVGQAESIKVREHLTLIEFEEAQTGLKSAIDHAYAARETYTTPTAYVAPNIPQGPEDTTEIIALDPANFSQPQATIEPGNTQVPTEPTRRRANVVVPRKAESEWEPPPAHLFELPQPWSADETEVVDENLVRTG